MTRPRTIHRTAIGLASLGLAAGLAAGCTTTASKQPVAKASVIATNASHSPTTITVWTFNTLANEVKAFKDDLAGLHTKYPWLTVKFVPGKDDAAYAKAVAAGNPPDVF